MSEIRVPLNARTQSTLSGLDAQQQALQQAFNAICTGVLSALDVEVADGATVRREGNELIVSTPDNEPLLSE